MNNDINIDPDYIRFCPDNSITDAETIRQISLYSMKSNDISLIPKIKKGFEIAGLYPEIMINFTLPEKLKK